jgi:hypothetical protein
MEAVGTLLGRSGALLHVRERPQAEVVAIPKGFRITEGRHRKIDVTAIVHCRPF